MGIESEFPDDLSRRRVRRAMQKRLKIESRRAHRHQILAITIAAIMATVLIVIFKSVLT